MMQKSTTFTTIFRVKKCHFHYDMQKILCLYLNLLEPQENEMRYLAIISIFIKQKQKD
jgi:hypothetical protein